MRASSEVSTAPSGEMVAPMIDAFLREPAARVPAQPARTPARRPTCRPTSSSRRCASPTARACIPRPGAPAHRARGVGAPGCRPRRRRRSRRRLSGDRDQVVEAMLLDPLAGRIDFDHVEQMTDEMLAAHRAMAAAVRVSRRSRRSTTLTVHVDDVDQMARDRGRRCGRGGARRDRGAGRGERDARHRELATRVPRRAGRDARHRLGSRARVPHGRVRRPPPSHPASFQRYMRERVAARLPVMEFNYLNGDAPDPEAGGDALRVAAPGASARSLLRGHRRERSPCVQRSAGRRLRRPPRRQDRRSSSRSRAISRSAKVTSRRSPTCRRTRSPSRSPPSCGPGDCS